MCRVMRVNIGDVVVFQQSADFFIGLPRERKRRIAQHSVRAKSA